MARLLVLMQAAELELEAMCSRGEKTVQRCLEQDSPEISQVFRDTTAKRRSTINISPTRWKMTGGEYNYCITCPMNCLVLLLQR